jgi:hypothetical protein
MHRVPAGPARAAVLLLALSPPLLGNAFLLFPEIPAMAVTCVVLWSAVGAGRERAWTVVASAVALGALPWLHRKYTPFAAGLLFVLWWERRHELARAPRRTAAVLLGFVLAAAAAHAESWLRWGTLLGPLARDGSPLSWASFRAGALGQLIGREHGLLIWAPIYLAALAAWWRARAAAWTLAVPVLLLYLPCAANDQWWGGFAPAARFLVPLVPLFALPLAPALTRPAFVRAVAVLAVPQLVISAIGWQRPRALWPRGDGRNRVLESIPGIGPALNDLLPSFRLEPIDGVAAALTLAAVAGALLMLYAAAMDPEPADEPR